MDQPGAYYIIEDVQLHAQKAHPPSLPPRPAASLAKILFDFVTNMIFICWLVLLGIFAFNLEAECKEPVALYSKVSFFILVAVTSFSGMSTVLSYCVSPSDPDGSSTLFWIIDGLFFLAVGGAMVIYLWGIVALSISKPEEECDVLYYLDLGYVVLYSTLFLLFCFRACISSQESNE